MKTTIPHQMVIIPIPLLFFNIVTNLFTETENGTTYWNGTIFNDKETHIDNTTKLVQE